MYAFFQTEILLPFTNFSQSYLSYCLVAKQLTRDAGEDVQKKEHYPLLVGK
jgi:hypothetical protein